jgi:asparagine synthetase B (glutamine-hydrolysing)
MSAVMFVRDEDPARRRSGVEAAKQAMGRFDLVVESLEHGPISVVWATFSGAPVSHASGAFVMGDVIPGPGPERLDATGYAARCANEEAPPVFDGLHYAATYDERGALTVAVDLTGALPLYHAVSGHALLAASSPALIAVYPEFRAEVDPLGLAGLLVTNGSVRGRTPYLGIRRMASGHVLTAAPGAAPREVRHHVIPISTESHDVPAEESALRLYEAFVDASRRHVPTNVPHTMFLSGGLDSRLITGVLARQGVPLDLITRGDPRDLEYRCARTVARRLHLPHRLVPHTDGSFDLFERAMWWDGMSSGPGSGGSEGLGEAMRDAQRHVVAGYSADSTMGGAPAAKIFDRDARQASPERLIARLNIWGVSLEALPRLLRRDVFGDSVQTVVDEVREDIMAISETFLARSWVYDLAHRQRFVMGRMWGRFAFGGWPRAPQLDREVLRVSAGIPMPVLTGRRVEREMLTRFHTDLARLRLDRNDPDTTPMLPGVMDLVRAGIDRRIRRFRESIGFPRPERRYYHRTFDFNGSAWRTARRAAEADRERLYALFERKVVDELLPKPEEPWQPTGLIEGAAGVKMLTGLSVWLRVGLGGGR